MKFYNVKTRKIVDVPDSEITVVTMKNNRKAAQATIDGIKLFKILSREDAQRLS